VSVTVGVDVGGTKIAAGIVAEGGTILVQDRAASPATDPAEIVSTIGGLVRGLVAQLPPGHEVEAVGASAAGFVDKARSTMVFAPNLAWRDEPLKAHLQQELGLPVVVENDANAAAWGEFRFGAGEDVDSLLMLTIGTGVGGGIVLDGELVRGGFGMGAEVGHLTMVPDGVRCGCGNFGCLESYASGSALVRVTRELARQRPREAAALLDRVGGDPAKIQGPEITALAREGDAFALARLADLGTWIGRGIASLVAVLDPQVVVIGGGVAQAGALLIDPVRESFENHVTARRHRPLLAVRRAELADAGLVGVADLARRR
jgi:glucokinase